MFLFYKCSILVSDKGIGYQILNQLNNLRVIKIPVSIVPQYTEIEPIASNNFWTSCFYKGSEFADFSTALVSNSDSAAMVERSKQPKTIDRPPALHYSEPKTKR